MIDDFVKTIEYLCDNEIPQSSAAYRLFGNGIAFNEFMEMLESVYPKWRIRIVFSAPYVVRLIAFLSNYHLVPPLYGDKILSFLYKDNTHLETCLRIFGREFRRFNEDLFRGAATPDKR